MKEPWPYPRIFAHRGGGSLAPENTLAAIRTGQELGFAALMAAKEAAPALRRGWLTDEFTPPDWAKLAVLDAVSLHTNHRKLPKDAVSRLRDKGYRVLLYTVNDAATAKKLLDAGVDGIFTDNLREFAARFPEAIRAP